MKTTRSRLRRTAACLVLAGALLSGCSLLPAASPRKDPAAAQPQPSDASAALNDGKLRMLYGSQGAMVLCGSTVLHEAASDETLTLLPDTLTGEAAYYWRSWADNTLPSGRRSALYDTAGAEVMAFEEEYNAALTGNDLILTTLPYLEFGADRPMRPEDCRVIDLTTKQDIPTPENAQQCAVAGDLFAFTCYDYPDELTEGEYDPDPFLSTRLVLQDKDGTVLREEDRCRATGFSASDANSIPTEWLMLDQYADGFLPSSSTLWNPATGEELEGFDQVCGNGTASFKNEDGSYRLVDLVSTEQSQTLCEFDRSISYYVPGAAICWQAGRDFRYQFHDLNTGEVKGVYNVDANDGQLAVYTTDGILRVYDRTTGALLTDLNVEPVENQDSAQVWAVGEDYVLLMLYPAGGHTSPTIRLYNAKGLVRQIEVPASTEDGYVYFAPLSLADGHAYFRYGYEGPNNTTLYDVLDENGNAVIKGLATCYSYYPTGSNALPDGAFVARKGFCSGWMLPTGEWLYSRSIFSTATDESDINTLI